jgi:hypothetical protein
LQIRTAVDARLATLWPLIQTRQATYMANHGGRPFQGLHSHSLPPQDGALTAPDRLTSKPTDQAEAWSAGHDLLATEPMSIRIDTYRTAAGWGYVATCQVRLASGVIWERSAAVGPEAAERTVAWHQVPNTPV